MKNLIIFTLLFVAATVFAAGQQYYSYPDATRFKADDRMLIYQNASGSRNLTGAGLKSVISQTAWSPNTTKVFQATSSSTQPVRLMSAIRDRRGVIQHIMYENGNQFKGVPGFNHTYIYPFNGMTAVSRTTPLVVGTYWLTRGYVGQQISVNGVSFTPKALSFMGYYSGLPNFGFVDEAKASQIDLDAFYWGTSSLGTLAPQTTYTIRSNMPTAWGSTGLYSIGTNPCTYTMGNTSSAKIMTNYSSLNGVGTGICRSTFRTRSAL
jgi:hypothetical protein